MSGRPQSSTSSRRRLGGRALGAIIDQGVVAAASFALMLLVRRQIGISALGEYSVMITALAALTNMLTAWVGDSLTVLDRFDVDIRGALIGTQLVYACVCAMLGVVLVVGTVDHLYTALWFGLMTGLWVCEELGRRVFMARFTFGALVLNDVIYAAGAFVGLAVLRTTMRMSLTVVVMAMAIGALTSILAAFVQLPANELQWARPRRAAMRELASFGIWRSAQAATRPVAQYIIRLLVIVFASKAVLGALEQARLVAQPAMVYVFGLASLLLPMYTEGERKKKHAIPLPVMTAAAVAPVALYALVAIVFKGKLAHVLFGAHASVSTVSIVGWLLVAVMFAAGQPVANLLIARRQSKEIFWVRLADSAIGLLFAIFLISRVSPAYAPWALASGMVVGTIALVWIVRRPHPNPDDASDTPPNGRTDPPRWRREIPANQGARV